MKASKGATQQILFLSRRYEEAKSKWLAGDEDYRESMYRVQRAAEKLGIDLDSGWLCDMTPKVR